MSRIFTLNDLKKEETYTSRAFYEKEIKEREEALKTLGVKYNEVSKKYILEKAVSSKQESQIKKLIDIIKQLEQKKQASIKIDNTPVRGGFDDDKRKALWIRETGITKKDVDEYIKLRCGKNDDFLASYIEKTK